MRMNIDDVVARIKKSDIELTNDEASHVLELYRINTEAVEKKDFDFLDYCIDLVLGT